MIRCPFCDKEFQTYEDLGNHLEEHHFLGLSDYYEWKTLGDETKQREVCGKCGKTRAPLSYIDPGNYYLPCWSCTSNKFEKEQYTKTIQAAIKDFCKRVLNDRYLQMFLIAEIYFKSTLTHTYGEFKSVLGKLKRYDRNMIWFLDWIPGYPKIITPHNVDGILAIPIENQYDFSNGEDFIKINGLKICFPEIATFDSSHHYRYNILNDGSTRETKRIKIKESGKESSCIKFYNSDNGCRSLFGIFDEKGNRLTTEKFSFQDLTVIKLLLLRNKNFVRLINSVINELIGNVGVLSDSVYLRNSVTINPNIEKAVNLCWTPYTRVRDNYINISIL